MPEIKRLLCLANSRKLAGRCIAGREVLPAGAGPWIRPISDRPSEEVSEHERQYEDGSDPRVLDVIDVPMIRHHPHACQTENWLLDPDFYWVRKRQIGWLGLQAYTENPQSLWSNGQSTRHGSNDEILRQEADVLPRSLYLIHVERVDLHVFVPNADYGDSKRRVQAIFQYRGVRYCLWVTDPSVTREYLLRENGTFTLYESCLCLSLGEPFKSNHGECRYKLVAAVIQKALVLP